MSTMEKLETVRDSPSFPKRHRWPVVACLALLICLPSFALVQKYAGLVGVAVYFAVVTGILGLLVARQSAWLPWVRRWLVPLTLLFSAGLVVVFAIAYPIEDGRGPGRSSDRDDGLNIAVARMVDGQSPYYPPHPDAGPLSLLPGAVILAIPFAVAGNAAWQNFFWLAVWWWATCLVSKDRAIALVWLVLLFAFSPALQYEFISGGDMMSNGIYVPVLILWALSRAAPGSKGKRSWIDFLVWGILGLGLASRPNFLFLLPLLFTSSVIRTGWRDGFLLAGTAGMMAVGISAGFYWQDPAAFSPMVAGNKIAAFETVLPHASLWIGGLSVAAAISVAITALLRPGQSTLQAIFRGTVIVLMVPMLAGVALQSLRSGGLDFGFLHPRYGLMYLFAAIWAWGEIFESGKAEFGRARIPDEGEARAS